MKVWVVFVHWHYEQSYISDVYADEASAVVAAEAEATKLGRDVKSPYWTPKMGPEPVWAHPVALGAKHGDRAGWRWDCREHTVYVEPYEVLEKPRVDGCHPDPLR